MLKREAKITLAALCTVPFIMVLGNSMLIPLLPKMKAAMDLTLFQVGLIITAFSVPAGLFIPVTGFLSDRYGRKTVMVPALVVYGLGGLVAGFTALFLPHPYWWLLGGRVIQGIGAGGTYQLAMALTGDIFETQERSKALGLLESSNGLGKVVSPIAGSAAGLIAWFAPFFIYGVLAIPIALLVFLLAREPRKNRRTKTLNQYFKTLRDISSQKALPLLAAFFSGMVVLFTLFGVLSLFADFLEQDYQITGFSAGLFIALPVLVMAITSYLAGVYLQKRLARLSKAAVAGGLALMAIALGTLPFLKTLYPFLVGVMVVGLGTGTTLPALNTLITSAASSDQRGLVTALYGTVRFFGVAIGPPAFGWALAYGRSPVFFGAAALSALGALLALTLLREEVMLPENLLKT